MPQQQQQKQLDKTKGLQQNVPHRVRGVLAGTGLYKNNHPTATDWPPADTVQHRFVTDCGWEGRLAALRWLIEFVGIGEKNGQMRPACRCQDDVGIEKLGGHQFPAGADADRLAQTWRAICKATAHGTMDRDHPLLQDQERNRSVQILIDYLTHALYGSSDAWLTQFVFRA